MKILIYDDITLRVFGANVYKQVNCFLIHTIGKSRHMPVIAGSQEVEGEGSIPFSSTI